MVFKNEAEQSLKCSLIQVVQLFEVSLINFNHFFWTLGNVDRVKMLLRCIDKSDHNDDRTRIKLTIVYLLIRSTFVLSNLL